MAITLYQESVPFSSQRISQPVSTNGAYSNPVVMSFAFDFTVCTNVLESVVYIRNDDANSYYRNVVVMLCKNDPTVTTPSSVYGIINSSTDPGIGNNIQVGGRFNVPATFSVEQAPILPGGGIYLTGQYTTQTMPITNYTDQTGTVVNTDSSITTAFSYGYDDLSNVEWAKQKPALIIPYIGTVSQSDTSYIPIRLRITWTQASSLFTIRDYYIDISYEKSAAIGVAM